MHPPAATVMTAALDTVHVSGVSEANETARPDEARAVRATGTPTAAPSGCAKAIVCPAFPAWTWNDCATSGAAA